MLDMIKIGQFIKKKRKEKGLTQSELASLFSITDRAVSKWERGLSLPDASIMLPLSKELGITLNELLSGEEIESDKDNKKTEEIILSLKRREEELSKILLLSEKIMLAAIIALLLIVAIAAKYFIKDAFYQALIIIISLIPVFIAATFALKIEQSAGYYECSNCHNIYIPSYIDVFLSTHIGLKRKMKCPSCNKKCWHKKVLKK